MWQYSCNLLMSLKILKQDTLISFEDVVDSAFTVRG